MKLVFLPAFILGLLAWPSTTSTSNTPVKASTPLSADEVVIYKAVLGQYGYQALRGQYGPNYGGNKDAILNVSQTTYPFDPSSPLVPLRGECLKGIQLENLSASSSLHNLTPEVFPGQRMKLVDPEKETRALFSMSEIAFDKEHRFGVVSYQFYCGNLCGHGLTLVFEKVNGDWRNANRKCGGWIS